MRQHTLILELKFHRFVKAVLVVLKLAKMLKMREILSLMLI